MEEEKIEEVVEESAEDVVEEATEETTEEAVEEAVEETPSQIDELMQQVASLEAKFAEFEQWVTETIGGKSDEAYVEEADISEEEEVAALDKAFYDRQQLFI